MALASGYHTSPDSAQAYGSPVAHRNREEGTYIGPQDDAQVELEGLSVLFKDLLLPSRAHFALGLQR